MRSGPDDSLNGSADSPADRAVLFFFRTDRCETRASGTDDDGWPYPSIKQEPLSSRP